MELSKPTVDALKEFGRVIVLAVIPVLVLSLSSDTLNLKATGLAVAVAVLKAIDEYLHEKGKLEENENLTKGLTRF